jgi:hypothetical protein
VFDPNSMLRLLSGSEKPAKPILRGWTKSPALDDCYWCSVLPRLSVLDLSKSLIRASWRIQEVFKLQKYTKIRLQVLWNEPMICRSFWAAVGLFWMRRLPRGKNWSDQTLERNAACALWQVSKVHYTCQLRPIDLPAHFAWENKGLLPQRALNSSWIWWDHWPYMVIIAFWEMKKLQEHKYIQIQRQMWPSALLQKVARKYHTRISWVAASSFHQDFGFEMAQLHSQHSWSTKLIV